MVLLVASLLTCLSVCSIIDHSLGFSFRNVYFVDDTDDENNNFVQPAQEIHDVHDNLDFSVEIVEDTTTYLTDGGRQQLTTVPAELFESSGSTELSSTPADEEILREAVIEPQIQKTIGSNLSAENTVTSTITESSEVATIRNTDGLDVQILRMIESAISFISKRLSIPIPGRFAAVFIGNRVKDLMAENDIYLTYPGTNWCGALRQDGTGFGIFEETDQCCKTFMECPETIQPGHQYHGLSNNGFIRR
jgi:Phospholipase A2